MARLDAQQLLQLGRNYMECRVLLSAVELNLFEKLEQAPLSATDLALHDKLDLRGLTILLDAATALGLLSKNGDHYHCPPELAPLLIGSKPDSVLPMLRHSANQWEKWSDLTEIVRGHVEPGRHPRTPESLQAFIEAMDVVAPPNAAATVEAIQIGSARSLLDIGGGPGTFTAAFLNAFPNLTATLFDLPDVIKIARRRLQTTNLGERVRFHPGDFYSDNLPTGFNLALLSAIIHQNSPQQNRELYRKAFIALNRGGRLLIRDHIMEPSRVNPRCGAVFAINMLVSTAGGNCYTFDEISSDLAQVGFENTRVLIEDEAMNGLIETTRPA